MTFIQEIDLPTSDSPQQVVGVYYMVMTLFGAEMAAHYDNVLIPKYGENWFVELRDLRRPHLNNTEKYDPAFVVNEPWKNSASITRECLPSSNPAFYRLLSKIRDFRNDYAHHKYTLTMRNLTKTVTVLESVATQVGLACAEKFAEVRERTNAIANGEVFTSQPDPLIKASPEARRLIEDQVEKTMVAVQRPRIGHAWTGPLGTRHLKLVPATKDIFDVAAGKSIKLELGPKANRTLDIWNQTVRTNVDIYMDTDGAVAGIVSGQFCLIGYIGVEPDVDSSLLQGFLLPEVYIWRENQALSVGTNDPLEFEPLPGLDLSAYEMAEVRVSTLDDVALYDDMQEQWLKIGTV